MKQSKGKTKDTNLNVPQNQKDLLNQWENNLHKETNKKEIHKKKVKNKLAIMKRATNRMATKKQKNTANLLRHVQPATTQEWDRGDYEKQKNIPEPAQRWRKSSKGEWERNYSLGKTQKSTSNHKFNYSQWPSPKP
jgi:hypothetical protein